jgi:branched-chain amino acid transport system ATP-binding protein
MLRVKSLGAHYGQVKVLKGISLHVSEGEIVTLIGANGAGKTTILNTVAGVHRPSAGSIEFMGRSIGGRPPAEIVTLGISLVPEGRQVFSDLTVRDNLLLGAYIRRARKLAREVEADLQWVMGIFPVLSQRLEQKGGTLSGGEQQMLAIARALMARPRLLVLDEPSMGLAPTVVQGIFQVLGQLNQKGMTILLVEQNARLALAVAHRGYVLETGSIVIDGESSFLARDREVQRAYLGKAYREIQDR